MKSCIKVVCPEEDMFAIFAVINFSCEKVKLVQIYDFFIKKFYWKKSYRWVLIKK